VERRAPRRLAAQIEQIAADWKEAVQHGSLSEGPKLDPALMFDDVFRELPGHLRRQREQLAAELQERSVWPGNARARRLPRASP
jgi:hypothetical protein